MVLNPRRRRRKMTAKQARYFGKRRARRTRGGRPKVVVVSANPKRRRRRVRAMARVVRRRFRRNPIGGTGFLTSTIAPAAFGAAGAIAVDYLSAYLPLPASLRSPTIAPITNIGLSLLAGWGVSLIAGSKRGGEAAAGGIIVALYNFANQQLAGYGMGPGMMGDPYAMNGGAGYGLNRYMGFIRRGPRQLGGPGPVGPMPMGPRLHQSPLAVNSQLGGPSNVTKFRINRAGQTGLGYAGPARTLGRYMAR